MKQKKAVHRQVCYAKLFGLLFIHTCPVKEQVKYNALSFTENKRQLDLCRSRMGTAQYMALADFRAGLEVVPSVLRRRYHIDHIPVQGLLRRGAWIHSKIMAFNFQSFFTYLIKKEAKLKAHFQNTQECVTNCGYWFLNCKC